jgi:flagellar hook protein FlgE
MALIGTLTTGVSALKTFAKALDVIGNNIANVNTTGFKGSTASFAESFSNTLRGSSPANGTQSDMPSIQVGTGVQLSAIATDFSQGSLNATGNTTDLGLSGNGFFIVKDATGGQVYATRDGQFRLDSNGFLVTQSGLRVQGLIGGSSVAPLGATVGDIQIGQAVPAGASLQSISVDTSGNVVEFYTDGTSATTNRVELQNFADNSALMNQGANLYTGLAAAGPVGGGILAGGNDPGTSGLGTVQSGTLESSNVDLTQQFSDLITTQRSFQAGARLITVSDTVLEDVVNLKTR